MGMGAFAHRSRLPRALALVLLALLGWQLNAAADAAADQPPATHTCVVKRDKTVWCWGANDRGQLGNGTQVESPVPVQVTGIDDAIRVVTGGPTSCALRTGGEVWCWGDNSLGQLGNVLVGDHATAPIQSGGADDFTSISLGYYQACGIRRAGQLRCWGYGQPGFAELTGIAATQVSVGMMHTCVVISGGAVKCIGNNDFGQLGDGTTTARSSLTAVLGIGDAVAVSAGYLHTCALRATKTVVCWGTGMYGSLGSGSPSNSYTPVTVAGLHNVKSIYTGIYQSCAVIAGGDVYCWSWNFTGRPDIDPGSIQYAPVKRTGIGPAAGVTGGMAHTCAVLVDRTVSCWGMNMNGALGNGLGSYQLEPAAAVAGVYGATIVTVGGKHACATGIEYVIRCWGANDQGQLGIGSGASEDHFAPAVVPGLSGVTKVSAGDQHTCAVTVAGSVYCWGSNTNGELGTGDYNGSPSPVQAGITDATGVSAGSHATCASRQDGTVACWGRSDTGLAGATINSSEPSPVTVAGLSNVTQLSVGGLTACAIDGGDVKCWGYGLTGELGDGQAQSSTTPVTVSLGVSPAVEVQVGASHACARLLSGAVKCWGRGLEGQLGAGGSPVSSPAPVAVSSLSGAGALGAGDFHSCAIVSGAGQCWGEGIWAQLGDGGRASSSSPVAVTGLSGATSIDGGLRTSCAKLGNGTVKCWGDSTSGAIGDGDGRRLRTTPGPVLGLTDVTFGDEETVPPAPDPDPVPAAPADTLPAPPAVELPAPLPPVPAVPRLYLSGRTLVLSGYALQSLGDKSRKGCPAKVGIAIKIKGAKKQHKARATSRRSGSRCLVTVTVKLPAQAAKAKQVTVTFSGAKVVRRTVTARRVTAAK